MKNKESAVLNSDKKAQKGEVKVSANDQASTVVISDNREENRSLQKEWGRILEKYPEANFLQSPEYGKMAELLGTKVITKKLGQTGYAEMIVRDARRGRYLEIACGPLLDWRDSSEIETALPTIRKLAQAEKCVFVRMRPQLINTPENLQILAQNGLKKSPMHLAAEHTVIIDLRKSEEELLADMRRQTRYEVRRGEKMGLKVTKSSSEAIFREFHAVQRETAKRQNFIPPSLKTLLAEKEALNSVIYTVSVPNAAPKAQEQSGTYSAGTKETRLDTKNQPTAREQPDANSKPIAYGLIIKSGKEADYYEAASTELNRKLPGAYALIWQAMKDLKKEGYERFNLWGIAPAGQPHHRYAGVTTFKTGFGGEIVEFVPAHDLIISKTKYLKNWLVEETRRRRRHL